MAGECRCALWSRAWPRWRARERRGRERARGVRLVEQATEGIEHVGGRRRWIGDLAAAAGVDPTLEQGENAEAGDRTEEDEEREAGVSLPW